MTLIYLLETPIPSWLLDEIQEIEKLFPNFYVLTLTEIKKTTRIKSYFRVPKFHSVLSVFYIFTHLIVYSRIVLRFRHEIGLRLVLRTFVFIPFILKQPKPHIHCHFASAATTSALILHNLIGIPYSFTAHAYDIYDQSVNIPLLKEKMINASFIRTISNYNRKYLLSLLPEIERKLFVIHCGIDLNNFPRYNFSKFSTFSKLVSASSLVGKKGFYSLIKELASLNHDKHKLSWIIAGEGKCKKKIIDLIESNRLSNCIQIRDPIPHHELSSLFKLGDIFLLPCVIAESGDRDGIPVILMEAMAMGCIVVSTSVSGIPELIHHGENGVLMKKASIKELLEITDDLKNCSQTDIESIRDNARLTTEKYFNINVTTKEISKLFQNYSDERTVIN